jgi:hypothetical protein
VKRSLRDFLENELLFEHLRTVYRHFVGAGGYERAEMIEGLVAHLEHPEQCRKLSDSLDERDAELLYVLRQVGGIAPRDWLFRELASRGDGSAEQWKRVFLRLRRRHLTYLIGSDTAYLPEGIASLLGDRISGRPPRLAKDIIPGASAVRQSVHGLVVALFNHIHQNPPRVMAEEDRIWKRDLEGLGDFFHTYLSEPAAGSTSVAVIRGRVSRVIELMRKVGFLEKRGKRLYLDVDNWADWSRRPEIERQSLFLSFLKDHYENIPIVLEALVDWRDAGWIPLDRLTEAVRYRAMRPHFHVLRVRPQAEVPSAVPGRRWVSACVHLLADLGLVYTGSDPDGEPVACATEGAVDAWTALHEAKRPRKRKPESSFGRAYAQPNFELLIPEESAPDQHRAIGVIAEIRSLDRFWRYVLTPQSVSRGVEEGLTSEEALETLEQLVQGQPPANVREAVSGWAGTAWWVEADGEGSCLKAERGILERIRSEDGADQLFVARNGSLRPVVAREDAALWLEERGFRVSPEERDPPREFGTKARDEYARALDAWKRRLEHSGEGTPQGSYWENVVPVQPPPDTAR